MEQPMEEVTMTLTRPKYFARSFIKVHGRVKYKKFVSGYHSNTNTQDLAKELHITLDEVLHWISQYQEV